MLNTPHLSGSEYQNPEQAARHVREKCIAVAASSSGTAEGARRDGCAIFVTMTGLPQGQLPQSNIRRAVRRAFGMQDDSGRGANPHPVHDIIIDTVDNHIRVYTAPR